MLLWFTMLSMLKLHVNDVATLSVAVQLKFIVDDELLKPPSGVFRLTPGCVMSAQTIKLVIDGLFVGATSKRARNFIVLFVAEVILG